MRADRLLSILLLLSVHRRMTAGELARRLEVSERTIHRDMEALSAAGVPVVAERGQGGGWALPDGYQTRLTGLSPAEIQALFLTKPGGLLADLGWREADQGALTKLLAALPAAHRRDAEYARQRIYVDTAGWQRPGEPVTCLPTLQDAVWQDRKLLMTYQRSDGSAVERQVDPLGLVNKGNVWYLVALSEGEVRTYRASRIRGVQLTDQPSERPDGFDLAAYWQQSTADFVASLPRYAAVLRASPEAMHRLRWAGRYARIESVAEPGPDGWTRVEIRFEAETDACEYALGFGHLVEVLEPPELRVQVIARARALLDSYAGR